MQNKMYVEKFYAVAGIYMIYNTKKHTIYIGKAIDLKERMRQHIKGIFVLKKDNQALINEFNEGGNSYQYRCLKLVVDSELDKAESLFYKAAKCMSFVNVHNIQELGKEYCPTNEELDDAKERIRETIKKEIKHEYCFRKKEDVLKNINKDWLGETNEEIIQFAHARIQELNSINNIKSDSKAEIKFNTVSLMDLINQGGLKYLIIGKMGDYIGESVAQPFSKILGEKLGDIVFNKGECLWAAEGPSLANFEEFQNCFGVGKDKSLYAIFVLTSSKYKAPKKENKKTNREERKQEIPTYALEYKGKKLYATAPEKNSKRKKVFVIKNFWTIEEDFSLQDFCDNYYKYGRRINSQNEYYPMDNIDSKSRLQPCLIISREEIKQNLQIQKQLKMDSHLFDDYIKNQLNTNPIKCNVGAEVTCYVLAEIIDYKWANLVE